MLTVYDIFPSIEGETGTAGLPAVFVRLAGCDLRCAWCDTKYAYEGGKKIGVREIVDIVNQFGIPRVVVTGGEPLVQEDTKELLLALSDSGQQVYLETSGSQDIAGVDGRVKIRMDLKPPSSGMSDKMLWSNLDKLKPDDELKIVIADETDYKWACEKLREYSLSSICQVNLTPATESLDPAKLAKWIVDDRLDVRLNLQLHKIIWGVDAEGV